MLYWETVMNPEVANRTESEMQSELTALDIKLQELRDRFPGGPEAHVAGYREWLRTELTYSSNALEGSTLTDIETRMVLEDDLIVPNKSLREHLEARDHAIAWDYATDELTGRPSLTVTDLLDIHQRVVYSTLHDEAGVLRRMGVRVAGSTTVFPNPLKVPDLVDHLLDEVNNPPGEIHPVLHAALAHLDLVKIHPFTDGNGRTARILMNLMLQRTGFVAMPIYPADRLDYLNAIEQADADEGAAFCRLLVGLELRTVEGLLSEG